MRPNRRARRLEIDIILRKEEKEDGAGKKCGLESASGCGVPDQAAQDGQERRGQRLSEADRKGPVRTAGQRGRGAAQGRQARRRPEAGEEPRPGAGGPGGAVQADAGVPGPGGPGGAGPVPRRVAAPGAGGRAHRVHRCAHRSQRRGHPHPGGRKAGRADVRQGYHRSRAVRRVRPKGRRNAGGHRPHRGARTRPDAGEAGG